MVKKKVVEPYIWVKAPLMISSSPFINVKHLKLKAENIIGGRDGYFRDSSDDEYLTTINRLFHTYFRSGIVRLQELPAWIQGSIWEDVVKLHIDLQTLVEEALKKETHDDYGGDLMVRQAVLMNETTSNFWDVAQDNAVDYTGALVQDCISASRTISVFRKPFIMSPTDIDWLVRANKLWLQQATTYKINTENPFKDFITNVVGGPRLKTMCGKQLGGYFHYSPARIDITLSGRQTFKKSFKYINDNFKMMLVHEFTHFLQMMYVKSNPNGNSSFWNLPDIGNVSKYYRSMWERDAYAVEFLYLYLRSKGKDLDILGNGEQLRLVYNAEQFKAWLQNNPEYKWHQRRMKDGDAEQIWLNGLVYGATKFVGDMQVNVPQNEKQEEDIDIKKVYRANVFSNADIVQAYIEAASEDSDDDDLDMLLNEDLDLEDEDDNGESDNSSDNSDDIPLEELKVGDSGNANKYQNGVSVSLEQPRWSDDEIEKECAKLNVENNKVLSYCANIEGLTYHCGLSDAIKSAKLYVQ